MNGVDMAALHHKHAIIIYFYQWLVIDTILIRSLCIDLTRAVLLGVHESKFARYTNVFIIGICTLDRITVHIKDYILHLVYIELVVRSQVYIIDQRHHGLSCCCIIYSGFQRGILRGSNLRHILRHILRHTQRRATYRHQQHGEKFV